MTQNGPRDYEDVSLNTHHLFWAIVRALPRILIVTAILCGVTFVSFSFITKQYTSEASVLLEPRSDSFAQSAANRNGGVAQAAVDPAAIASQIQLLRSRETLLSVIDELDLRSNAEFAGGGTNIFGALFSIFLGNQNGQGTGTGALDERIVSILLSKMAAAQARDREKHFMRGRF